MCHVTWVAGVASKGLWWDMALARGGMLTHVVLPHHVVQGLHQRQRRRCQHQQVQMYPGVYSNHSLCGAPHDFQRFLYILIPPVWGGGGCLQWLLLWCHTQKLPHSCSVCLHPAAGQHMMVAMVGSIVSCCCGRTTAQALAPARGVKRAQHILQCCQQSQAWWCRQQRPWCGSSAHTRTVPLRYIGSKR